jgi:hypothetical protein
MTTPSGRYDDTILRLATVVVQIAIILCWLGVALIAVLVPAGIIWRAELIAQLATGGFSANAHPLLLTVAATGGVILFLTTRFLGRLLALMRTVETDPFVPENATRLRTMAWLLLAIELLGFAIGILIHWTVKKPEGFEFSFTGLIAVLSLFVLARVFTRGTEMREEIEGTV